MRIALLDWGGDPRQPATTGLSDIAWDLGRRLRALGDEVVIVGAYDREAERSHAPRGAYERDAEARSENSWSPPSDQDALRRPS